MKRNFVDASMKIFYLGTKHDVVNCMNCVALIQVICCAGSNSLLGLGNDCCIQ